MSKADSTSRPPWSHLEDHRTDKLDRLLDMIAPALTTAEMYYFAHILTRRADHIENGEDVC